MVQRQFIQQQAREQFIQRLMLLREKNSRILKLLRDNLGCIPTATTSVLRSITDYEQKNAKLDEAIAQARAAGAITPQHGE